MKNFQDKVVDSEEEILSVEGAGETPAVPRPSSMPDSNVKLIEEALQTLKARLAEMEGAKHLKIITIERSKSKGFGCGSFLVQRHPK